MPTLTPPFVPHSPMTPFPSQNQHSWVTVLQGNCSDWMRNLSQECPAKLTLIHPNQGPGLVQMDSISESYHVQVAGEGVILLVQSVELKDQDQTVQYVMESSPLKVKEDDEVDNLDIKLKVKKKSKRVYQSPSPEVGLKISRSLKSLNAKTGLFSNRMKIIHQDPMLQAQRVAAIKKAKGTVAARKQTSKAMKAYFSDPINRQKRSMAMKGVKFYCQNCGREGHRRHYCPELKDSLIDRRFACRLCGEKGHNRRTCRKLRISHSNGRVIKHHQCKICHQYGHNSRTCPQVVSNKIRDMASRRSYKCRLCHREGHNIRTCPSRTVVTEHPED
ncbi:uncharacterized protein LOC133288624 isoform X2 [Gastrolobium bilobum]|uniref:uncharacterized protein LOC133288624 isoform X2 n=1 Tax=Gastrolobium bilobum TaxID=150636 RepID=UPI002AB13FBF|nr:uncharacterized protein LOC133288624 isoform X2 [Gastrolobium bilobum]